MGLDRVYFSARGAVIRSQPPHAVWERNLPREVAFWRARLPDRVSSRADYQIRADPRGPVTDPAIIGCLDQIDDQEVAILDVGSGPLTAVGMTHRDKRLRVTAVDPLASDYARDMERSGITAPVVPVPGCGEDLLSIFEPETFDLAFARNALDHGFDPARAVENMVELVKPGRFVVLRHKRCEARRRYYSKRHQWNLDIEGQDLILWRRRHAKANLSELLRGRAAVECGMDADWLLAILTKTA